MATELSSPDCSASDVVFQSVWWFRYMCLNVYLYISLYKGFKSVYKETYSKVESITNKVGQGKKELHKEGQD